MTLLRRIGVAEARATLRRPLDPDTLLRAGGIVEDVRRRGAAAVIEHGVRFGDLEDPSAWIREPGTLHRALEALPDRERRLLTRVSARIRRFAEAQLESFGEVRVPVPGGCAGHTIRPVERAGCYAPGGRFPLPSSVLMTAVTAKAAGVEQVWVASPNPAPVTLAAAALAGVDGLLAVGGAQAVAALAFGAGPVPACDVVVGPGNRWVTAAKHIVSAAVGIDMLAGPSELVVLADDAGRPDHIAADLLALAEHDVDALPVLVALDEKLADAVESCLHRQLEDLPTAETARRALQNGFCVVAAGLEAAVEVCNRLAPEHLAICLRQPEPVIPRLRNHGALFVGRASAEVFGDYGAGPNHVLPTGGSARHTGGLSVMHFLRWTTWLRIDDSPGSVPLQEDARDLAMLEGLAGHARAAALRCPEGDDGLTSSSTPGIRPG